MKRRGAAEGEQESTTQPYGRVGVGFLSESLEVRRIPSEDSPMGRGRERAVESDGDASCVETKKK